MVSRRKGFDSCRLASELARPDGTLRAHRSFGEHLMRDMLAEVDACSEGFQTAVMAALRMTGPKGISTFDLDAEGGRGPQMIEVARRLPPPDMRKGWAACITLDGWPARRVLVETFLDGRRHGGHPDSPAVVEISRAEMTKQFWLAGYEVTQAVMHPASCYADVCRWSGDLAVLAMPGHDRLLEVIASAEARGVSVAVHSDGVPGVVLYSPGGGQPYELLGTADYKKAHSRNKDAPGGLLSIQSNARGSNWKAVRTIHGVLHGDTAELPAICASRLGYKGTEVSEALMRDGVRVDAPAPAFQPR